MKPFELVWFPFQTCWPMELLAGRQSPKVLYVAGERDVEQIADESDWCRGAISATGMVVRSLVGYVLGTLSTWCLLVGNGKNH